MLISRSSWLAALILVPMVAATTSADPATQPTLAAFPGAEGFGAVATGGRGGEVVHVTNLDDKGPGSLRDALSKPNRIVVFDVGGIILTKAQIDGPSNVTIAGQTAPGDGITLYGPGLSFSKESNVIVRYLRLRGSINNSRGSKQLNVSGGSKMIFDHVSVSWGRWDNLGFTEHSSDITLQNSISGEAIDPQRFGALIDSSDRITVVRTLWLDNQNRNPKGKANMQYINNVVYNWGGGGYGGGHSGAEWRQDLINNVFIKGPSSKGSAVGGFDKTDMVFTQGNLADLDVDGKLSLQDLGADQYRPMTKDATPPTFTTELFNHPPVDVKVMPTAAVLDYVLEHVGCSLHRDVHDQRMIEQVKSLGTKGEIIKDESAVGGIGELKGGEAPTDTDHDGIPDDWEKAHQLNPNDPSDATKIEATSGYVQIELYINSLAK